MFFSVCSYVIKPGGGDGGDGTDDKHLPLSMDGWKLNVDEDEEAFK